MKVDIGLKMRKSFKSIDLSIWSLVPKAGPAENRSNAEGISRRYPPFFTNSNRSKLYDGQFCFCVPDDETNFVVCMEIEEERTRRSWVHSSLPEFCRLKYLPTANQPKLMSQGRPIYHVRAPSPPIDGYPFCCRRSRLDLSSCCCGVPTVQLRWPVQCCCRKELCTL